MEKNLARGTLMQVARAIKNDERIAVERVDPFLAHTFAETSQLAKYMLRLAAWISLFFASVLVIFPEVGEKLIEILPSFFLLPERLAKALDYVWGLVGEPVGKRHLMYHLPNIIVYAFGAAGLRQLWKRMHKNNWKDQVLAAQKKLRAKIENGTGQFSFTPGFSILFVGSGDMIARSLVKDDGYLGPTISTTRQPYTNMWGKYSSSEGEEGFLRVIEQFNARDAGEYVLFPVVDDQLFLPDMHEYDMAPHRVDIAVRRMREFESARGWSHKRIIIVGDKEQKSRFVTTSRAGKIASCEGDDVSLRTIDAAYDNITVVDPTDVTLTKIMEIADGRDILFRSSDQGFEKYSKEFYHRLDLLGYEPTRTESLIVGYDISDLETEHQVVARKQPEYLPVILSRDVFDELVNKHLREDAYIFVPRLVKRELQRLVKED